MNYIAANDTIKESFNAEFSHVVRSYPDYNRGSTVIVLDTHLFLTTNALLQYSSMIVKIYVVEKEEERYLKMKRMECVPERYRHLVDVIYGDVFDFCRITQRNGCRITGMYLDLMGAKIDSENLNIIASMNLNYVMITLCQRSRSGDGNNIILYGMGKVLERSGKLHYNGVTCYSRCIRSARGCGMLNCLWVCEKNTPVQISVLKDKNELLILPKNVYRVTQRMKSHHHKILDVNYYNKSPPPIIMFNESSSVSNPTVIDLTIANNDCDPYVIDDDETDDGETDDGEIDGGETDETDGGEIGDDETDDDYIYESDYDDMVFR